jgi:hypothetical protein
VEVVRAVPWWGVLSSAAAPVLLVGGWAVAAGLQPRSIDPVTSTISAVLLYRAVTYLPAIPLGAIAYLVWQHAPALIHASPGSADTKAPGRRRLRGAGAEVAQPVEARSAVAD